MGKGSHAFHLGWHCAGPDSSQNYQVLGGSLVDGTTTIIFRRLLFSNDTNDRIITPTNMSIIWWALSLLFIPLNHFIEHICLAGMAVVGFCGACCAYVGVALQGAGQ